ncbi:3-oxoacyl-[acyl-carrier-protein] synthase III C-terminal domain-containing protein [Streptomyces sp. HNM0645]|uniref:3-oxoacyl-[acyl-carrier-protein] synthase III C-terminal domain-containing protein n=1 Tax=Streptomyces sp. HNM0645 TaxID=2782343 RepID=UPI0024B73865|nr:3-oxoacyl-[acyl-carrier-protein] synthase III C-terminal domain-containing protein [Streptomyces sp. HNM0645]MDI9886798.1 3-oxoacyl-[acyl-carrier-protein] synthase III C-terminal domain-containing protein [Streptomyces sp. HNM0645]
MRLPRPLGLSGLSTWIPEARQTARHAVEQGLVEAGTAEELGYEALPVADKAPPEMAVLAARAALESTGTAPTELGMVLHAWMYYQGHDLWSPPHYIADQLGARQAEPLGIQQVCNGGAAAVEVGAARLLADPALGDVLVTTADRFAAPGFDRWRGDYGIAYGDGATALLLHSLEERSADLLLHTVTTVAAPHLEGMHRGRDAFGPMPRSVSDQVDMRRTKKAFFERGGMEAFTRASEESLTAVVERCLAAGGLALDSPLLRCVVPPRLGAKAIDLAYAPVLRKMLPAEILTVGGNTGHLGAGDAAASLAELWAGRVLSPGEYALVVSAGAGFTWSCLLVSAV